MAELVAEGGVREGDQVRLLTVVVLVSAVSAEAGRVTLHTVVDQVEEIAAVAGMTWMEVAESIRVGPVEVDGMAEGSGIARTESKG